MKNKYFTANYFNVKMLLNAYKLVLKLLEHLFTLLKHKIVYLILYFIRVLLKNLKHRIISCLRILIL